MPKKPVAAKKKGTVAGAAAAGGGSRSGPVSGSSKDALATATAATGPARSAEGEDGSEIGPQVSVPEQQRLLNHFAAAFDGVLADDDFAQLLREIKAALFERDFARAFGREDYLDAYAARWSPTRALGYAGVFRTHIPPHVKPAAGGGDDGQTGGVKMVCIGGCAAEHVAFASYLHSQTDDSSDSPSSNTGKGALTLLDSAPWASVATKMQNTLTSPLPLSKYASAAAKASNTPLIPTPEHLRLQTLQNDALELTESQWAPIFAPENPTDTVIVTLLFTLNELYTNGGIIKTTKFLKALEASLPDQALLLVVDSPGSYSEAAVGKEKKKYPMQWLLHHTLTDPASTAQQWTRLESHDSIWFRLSDQLSYPIQLENMRYQLHLYRIDKAPSN